MSKKAANDNVRVMVRVRPFNKKEIDEVGGVTPVCTLAVNSNTQIICKDPNDEDNTAVFPFDCIFWSMPPEQVPAPIPVSDQVDVYREVGLPQLESMFDGYNGCIFAYGQTSSGKTHSMMGYPGHGRGVTPRLCEELFARIEEAKENPAKQTTYTVKVAFLEIYNEKVQDLLAARGKGHNLKIIQDPKRGPIVKDLTEIEVHSWGEVDKILEKGMETRSVAATAMNDTSSRSHAVVQIALEMEDSLGMVGGKQISRPRRSRANLVDLAGSEKVQKSKVEGAGLKEAIGINQSLTCLGRVIDGLVEGKTHVPYRDSVLTCLLCDSLGGNSRTTMLAALSPAGVNYEETMGTLRWASRARKIVNKVKVNEDPAAALIRGLQEELQRMKESIQNGDIENLQHILGEGGLPEGQSMVGVVAQRAAEIETLSAKFMEMSKHEETAEAEREEKWAEERMRLEAKHELELAELKAEQQELAEAKIALEKEHAELQGNIDEKRKIVMLDRLRQGGQISQQKAKQSAADARTKKLKRDLIFSRFRNLSHKARHAELEAQHLPEAEAAAAALCNDLEKQLLEARQRINDLEALDVGGGAMVGPDGHMMPTEETVYDGPVCDMCLEQPAQFRCMNAPCSGDVFCVWCDANQHRTGPNQMHERMPLVAPCECCGAREAEIICPGFNNAQLCMICYDNKMGRHTRNTIVGIACEFCGLRDAEVLCQDCPARLCSACDELKHRSGKRANHRRQPAAFDTMAPPLDPEGVAMIAAPRAKAPPAPRQYRQAPAVTTGYTTTPQVAVPRYPVVPQVAAAAPMAAYPVVPNYPVAPLTARSAVSAVPATAYAVPAAGYAAPVAYPQAAYPQYPEVGRPVVRKIPVRK